MRRPDPDHAPTWAETVWRSSPAAEREEESHRLWRLLLVAGSVGACVFLAAILVLPAVMS